MCFSSLDSCGTWPWAPPLLISIHDNSAHINSSQPHPETGVKTRGKGDGWNAHINGWYAWDDVRDGEKPQVKYFVNPEILEDVEDKNLYEEGCLSVPDVFDTVERPERVKLTYLDYNGDAVKKVVKSEKLKAAG